MKLINPHGGTLVNREVKGRERDQLMRRATTMPKLQLNARQISDVLMIATGAYSPIEGFMGEADYNAVVSSMRLANGVAWPIPITMAVSTGDARRLQTGQDVALYQDHLLLGVLHLAEKYTYHKAREADSVYRTTDLLHPGVQAIHNQGDWLLGGCISLINRPDGLSFVEYRKDPEETRTMFKDRGWRRIVAFQTRNPVHRAHEYIQKCAMEIADGLLLHPLVGEREDYDPLMKMIGDARLVLIGEASHGTHEFYRERAQITKLAIRERDHLLQALLVASGEGPEPAPD